MALARDRSTREIYSQGNQGVAKGIKMKPNFTGFFKKSLKPHISSFFPRLVSEFHMVNVNVAGCESDLVTVFA